MACISSGAASSTTARAASCPPVRRSRTRWSSSSAATAPSPTARHPDRALRGSGRTQPERWPSSTSTWARSTTCCRALFAGRLLLQDLHAAAELLDEVYEPLIRRAAGLGKRPAEPDPTATTSCTPIATCWSSAPARPGCWPLWPPPRAGARVILADEQTELGGCLLAEHGRRYRRPAGDATGSRDALGELSAARGSLLPRTTVDRLLRPQLPDRLWSGAPTTCRRRAAEHARVSGCGRSARGRSCWRPARTNGRWCSPTTTGPASCWPRRRAPTSTATASCRASRAVVLTNNDSAYAAALDLARRRRRRSPRSSTCAPQPGGSLAAQAKQRGLDILTGAAVTATERRHAARRRGCHGVDGSAQSVAGARRSARLRPRPDVRRLEPGRPPVLASRSGKLRYDDALTASCPTARCRRSARPAPATAPSTWPAASPRAPLPAPKPPRRAGFAARGRRSAPSRPPSPAPIAPALAGADRRCRPRHAKRFVDFQNDVTAADLALAAREGFQSVEHLKRYTTTGMGTDQGKTSNVNALAILAEALGLGRSRRSAPPPSARPIRR